jgi:two-component system, OmpR family, response regulator
MTTDVLDTQMTQRAELILVVDDDAEIRDLVSEFLTRHGYTVRTARDSAEMDAAIANECPHLIILDLMLPGEDGLSICRRLAADGVAPIIMLSAMGEDTDRIVGLELGADDYLAKPCNPRELLARVRAQLRRRTERPTNPDQLTAACEFAGWRLDLVRHELRSPRGVAVNLTSGEFALLRAFAEHPQRVLTRDQLLEFARGPNNDAFDRAIDVQLSRLRRKLAESGATDGAAGELIRTIRHEGYMFVPKVTRRS